MGVRGRYLIYGPTFTIIIMMSRIMLIYQFVLVGHIKRNKAKNFMDYSVGGWHVGMAWEVGQQL